MNIENMRSAINIMKRAGKIDMCSWQEIKNGDKALGSEENLHYCGTAACFAGWIAVSPEWKKDGGRIDERVGSPYIPTKENLDRNYYYAKAIAYWLDIPESYSCELCALNTTIENEEYYGVKMNDITKEMVIGKLEEIIEKHTNDKDFIFKI